MSLWFRRACLSFHCFFEATNLKFCSKMDSNWSIAISFWYLWTWKFCFWSRIYPRQLVMTKKCPKSRLGGKKCQICATLAKSPYVLVSLLYKNYYYTLTANTIYLHTYITYNVRRTYIYPISTCWIKTQEKDACFMILDKAHGYNRLRAWFGTFF